MRVERGYSVPELTYHHVPQLIEQNRNVNHEVNRMVKVYLKDYHLKGWTIIEGARRWIEQNHSLIQAPIDDPSLGGFILFKKNKHFCYLNTGQPRVYQNFVLLHELYHILSVSESDVDSLHLIESDMDVEVEERKADYFASLLLIDSEDLIMFYTSLKDEPLVHRIFLTMNRFSAPYKSVLIRLFELDLISPEEISDFFDVKFDLEKEFKKLGLDPIKVQSSYVIKFDNLEEMVENGLFPEIAQSKNVEVLHSVKDYFNNNRRKMIKGDIDDE